MVARFRERVAGTVAQEIRADEKREEVCRKEAERLEITFNGFLKWPDGKRPPLPMFTDTMRTRSSFTIFEGETTENALARTRENFYK